MPHSDTLVTQLAKLRTDATIRTLLEEARRALAQDQFLTAGTEAPRGYTKIVERALHHLSREHLKPYVDTLVPGSAPLVSLLSYASSFGFPPARITDYECDCLSEGGSDLAAHVNMTLDRRWKPLTKLPRHFAVHDLAQRRIKLQSAPPVRVPLYICSSDETPAWLSGNSTGYYVRNGVFIFDRPDGERLGPVGALLPLPLSVPVDAAERLEQLVRELSTFREPDERAGDPNLALDGEHYVQYAEYLSALLERSDPPGHRCLCTIAVSDELSNTRLGTVMLISDIPCLPSVAAGIHGICHDFFDALYQFEFEAHTRQKTVLSVASWLTHEIQHWANRIHDHGLKLTALARGNPQIADHGAQIRAIGTALPFTIEFLRQFLQNPSATQDLEYCRTSVQALIDAYAPEHRHRYSWSASARAGARIPVGVLLVIVELVRNAVRHRDPYTPEEWHLEVGLTATASTVTARVRSRPQIEGPLAQLRDLILGKREAGGLGIKLIRKVVASLQGQIDTEDAEAGTAAVVCTVPNPLRNL